MTRVSPPDDDREFPGPQASIRVTRAPCSSRCRAVHPPKAPAPTTAMCGLDLKVSSSRLTEEHSRMSKASRSQGFKVSRFQRLIPFGLRVWSIVHTFPCNLETLQPCNLETCLS